MARFRALALFALAALAGWLVLSGTAGNDPSPDTSLDPVAVVRIQLDALREDGSEGIQTAFRFASPENRASTGPLERFAQLVRSEPYAPLLGHASAELGAVHRYRTGAAIPVIVTAADGSRHGFMFVLSRRTSEACQGCWMTDGVMPHPLPEPRPRGQLI